MEGKVILETIDIRETEDTPNIAFNPETLVLKVFGPSFPEDVEDFYSLLFKFADDFEISSTQNLTCEFDFSVINSPSNKIIYDFLTRLEKTKKVGKKVDVRWIYDEYDIDMLDIGNDFNETLSIPFEFVAKPNDYIK